MGLLYRFTVRGAEMLTLESNVVAYTITSNPPRPYRFKSTTLKFQVPGLKSFPRFLQGSKFLRAMSETDTWKTSMNIFHKLRTWARMTVWGDRVCGHRLNPGSFFLYSVLIGLSSFSFNSTVPPLSSSNPVALA